MKSNMKNVLCVCALCACVAVSQNVAWAKEETEPLFDTNLVNNGILGNDIVMHILYGNEEEEILTVFNGTVSGQDAQSSESQSENTQSESTQAADRRQENTQSESAQAADRRQENTQSENAQADKKQQDTQPGEGQDESESEYANLAIANVSDYVNVRSTPDTSGAIVGKIYDGAVAQILAPAGENDEWFQVVSGNVEGYIKAEFFLYGDAAAEVIDDYVTRYAVVKADRLNVRREPDIESKRIGYINAGEKVKLLEDCGEWLKVQYTDSTEGYVAAEYVTITEEFIYAKSIEEERAEAEERKKLAERQAVSEKEAPEQTINAQAPTQTEFATSAELRAAIIEDAMQYLGNVYIHGGKSLSGGTDCSGFTCFIYADFGYSLSRTPSGQLSSAGRSIDYSEIQPGDIICYTSNGGKSCTHVALYIGDGQIIHSANSRKGVIISNADYSTIMGVKNVID